MQRLGPRRHQDPLLRQERILTLMLPGVLEQKPLVCPLALLARPVSLVRPELQARHPHPRKTRLEERMAVFLFLQLFLAKPPAQPQWLAHLLPVACLSPAALQ